MDYEVSWMPQARKKLEKLSQDNSIAIIKKVEEAKSNPFHYLGRLAGTKAYKLRVGDYRVIIDLKVNATRVAFHDARGTIWQIVRDSQYFFLYILHRVRLTCNNYLAGVCNLPTRLSVKRRG